MNHPRQTLTQLIMTILPTDFCSPAEHGAPKTNKTFNPSPLFAEALADAIFQQFQLTPRGEPKVPAETSDAEPEADYAFDDLHRLITVIQPNPYKPTAHCYDL